MICNKVKRIISAIVLLVFMVTTLSIGVTAAEPQIEGSEGPNMSCSLNNPKKEENAEGEETNSQRDGSEQCEDICGDYIIDSSDELMVEDSLPKAPENTSITIEKEDSCEFGTDESMIELSIIEAYKRTSNTAAVEENCGYNVRCSPNESENALAYSFDKSTGELTISGKGRMEDYFFYCGFSKFAPWYPYRDDIKSVTIEYGVTYIGEHAFDGCKNLISVTIPKSMIRIGNFAFSGCSGLTSVYIPDNMTGNMEIGESAFYGCKGLRSVIIDIHSRVYISRRAFACCENLRSFTYYGNTIHTDEGILRKKTVFADCPKLKAVTVSSWNWRGGDHPFCGKKAVIQDIRSDQDPDRYEGRCGLDVRYSFDCDTGELTILGTGTMDGYSQKYAPWDLYGGAVKSVTIKNGVTNIGDYAFYRCINLKSVKIPNSVTEIGITSFAYCKSLKSIKIPNSITRICRAAFCNCGLKSVTVSNSVRVIESYAFFSCKDLESADLRGEIEMLTERTFADCKRLKSITIPASVKEVDVYALWGCMRLSSITYHGIAEPKFYNEENALYHTLYGDTDYFVPPYITVKVPRSYVGDYFGGFRVTKR